jgi:hypothetical protein
MEQDQDYGANSPEQSTQSNLNLSSSKTSGDYLVRKHIATWSNARGVWETTEQSLLCEHSVLFLATWPTSGMTQNGQAYELPTPEHHTTDSESSSLPTPTTQDNSGKCRDHGGDLLHDLTCGCSRADRRAKLPTPTVSDQYTANLASTQQSEGSLHSVTLAQIVNRPDLLPTPQTGDGLKGMTSTPEHRIATGHQVMLSNHAPQLTNTWGRFEPAIRRWETVLSRPAPAPTNPDGKDGNHRLSSKFTEWMMGLPDGWITDAGLTRNEELKACGNGVVPQQAELALRMLLK